MCDYSFALARPRGMIDLEMENVGKLSWERVEEVCSNFVSERWQLGDTIDVYRVLDRRCQ